MSDNNMPLRGEILFLYDAKDCNPNGDPLDENRPRIDPETDTNMVTDVRLKRTIRDYIYTYHYNEKDGKTFNIFVRADDKDGKRKNVTTMANSLSFKTKDDCFSCWDVRVFGATLAIDSDKEKDSKDKKEKKLRLPSITGPVQLRMGRSINPVSVHPIQGTSVFSSHGTEQQGSMRMEYQVCYSLIAFWGVINPTTAIRQDIPLTEKDIEVLMEAVWEGTINLTTRSKIGQIPRLLLRVNYKPEFSKFFLGELERGLKVLPESGKNIDNVRSTEDYTLDISTLVERLKGNLEKIDSIYYRYDKALKLSPAFISDPLFKDVLKPVK